MTLASSGSINMVGPDTSPRRSIGVELGNGTLTTPVSLLSAAVLALTGKSGGPITMPGDFYGRSTAFIFNDTVSVPTTNYNLRARAIAAGWDQVVPLIATTTNNNWIYSTDTTIPAMYSQFTFYPSGSSWAIINNSIIVGAGGAGGAGGSATGATLTAGSAGSAGGVALLNNSGIPTTFDNTNGLIGGGGGGGGGGGAGYYVSGKTSYGASGGGGGGGIGGYAAGLAAGGVAGSATGNSVNYAGANGASGGQYGGGIGGSGGSGSGGAAGGNGGNGSSAGAGAWGAAGAAGAAGTALSGGSVTAGGAGGAGGLTIQGITYITIVGSPGYFYGSTA